jgi:ABC-type Fe3+/spermidine/putrescine transport system ATPase subunit
MALSDRIAVVAEGRVLQYGAPREVYARPTSGAVADFMGLVNIVPARVVRASGDDSLVALAGEHTVAVPLPPGLGAGAAVQIAVRPENLTLTREGIPGKVAEATYLGSVTDCHVMLHDGTRVRVQAGPGEALAVGQRVHVRLDGAACTVFPG